MQHSNRKSGFVEGEALTGSELAPTSDYLHVLSELMSFTGASHYHHCLDKLRQKLGAAVLYVAEPAATLRDCNLDNRTLSLLALSSDNTVTVSEGMRRLHLDQCNSGRSIVEQAEHRWTWQEGDIPEPVTIHGASELRAVSIPFTLGTSGDPASLTACFEQTTADTYHRVAATATAVGLVHDFIQERKSHQLTDSLARLLLSSRDDRNAIASAIDCVKDNNRLCSVTFVLAGSTSTSIHSTQGAHHSDRTIQQLLDYFSATDTSIETVFFPDIQNLERDAVEVQQKYPGLPASAFRPDRERFARALSKVQVRGTPTVSDLTICIREGDRPFALVRLTGCAGRPYSLRPREVLRIVRAAPFLRGIAQRALLDSRREGVVRSLNRNVAGIHTLNKEIRQNAVTLRQSSRLGPNPDLTRPTPELIASRRAEELRDSFYSVILGHVASAIYGADVLSIRAPIKPNFLSFVHTFGDAWSLGSASLQDSRKAKQFALVMPPTSAGAEVFLKGEPRFVAAGVRDGGGDEPFDPTFPLRSAAYVPIQAGDVTIGVLDVRSTMHDFTLEDRAACEILGQILGLTVELRSSIQDEVTRSTVHVQALEDLNHQIKTPLGLVMKRADLAIDALAEHQERYLASTGRSRWRPHDHVMFLRAVAGNALRVAQSVSAYVELASYGTLEARRDRLTLSALRLKVRGLVRDAGLLAREDSKTIRLEDAVTGRAAEGACVELSLDQFQQTVQQVLDNAVKYAWENSQIVVKLDADREQFRLSVMSRGVRVPPRDEDRVFERNWRAPAAIDASDAGSGIGLWIVRAIVEAAGGHARLAASGDRTTVTLTFPLKEAG